MGGTISKQSELHCNSLDKCPIDKLKDTYIVVARIPKMMRFSPYNYENKAS